MQIWQLQKQAAGQGVISAVSTCKEGVNGADGAIKDQQFKAELLLLVRPPRGVGVTITHPPISQGFAGRLLA